MARTGSIESNGSGDIFIAFSTGNDDVHQANSGSGIESVPNESIVPLFEATVQATEEAIVNALVAGRTLTGHRGNTVTAIDHGELQAVLREHNRLTE